MFDQTNGEWIDVTFRHQVKRCFEGTAVIEGCQVSRGSSGSAVEFAVDAGAVQFGGSRYDINAQSPVADPGESEERYDVIYASESGDVDVLKGDPGDTVPPSTAGMDIVVLAVARIPPNAGGSNSLAASDISDRRMPPVTGTASADRETERFPVTSIEPNGSVSTPIMAQPGQRLVFYKWGAVHVDDGTPHNAPTGVEIQLLNAGGNVIYSETGMLETGTPLFEVSVTGTDVQVYQLRLANNSDTFFQDPEGLAGVAQFAILD